MYPCTHRSFERGNQGHDSNGRPLPEGVKNACDRCVELASIKVRIRDKELLERLGR